LPGLAELAKALLQGYEDRLWEELLETGDNLQ
jgi:hypothetical protein